MKAVIAAGVLLLAAGVAAWLWWTGREPPPRPPVSAPAPPPVVSQGPRHPLPPAEPTAPPLPPLNASDAHAVGILSGLLGPDGVAGWLNPENLVRNIVATVDNLPRESVAARVNPVKPVPGALRATGKDATLAIDPRNQERYRPAIALVERLDTARMVDAYVAAYPLFQQAYVELGYPQGHFNDRLVEVIDHLLEAPEPPGPVLLTQPKVLYEFADPELESRSAGQKILIRMGPANAAKVKAKLREIRAEVLARGRR